MKPVLSAGKTWDRCQAREEHKTSAKRWKKKMGLIQSAGTTATEPYLQSDVKRVTGGTRVILFFFCFFHDMVGYKLMFPSFSVNLEFKKTDTLFFRVVVLAPVPVGRGKSTNSVWWISKYCFTGSRKKRGGETYSIMTFSTISLYKYQELVPFKTKVNVQVTIFPSLTPVSYIFHS